VAFRLAAEDSELSEESELSESELSESLDDDFFFEPAAGALASVESELSELSESLEDDFFGGGMVF